MAWAAWEEVRPAGQPACSRGRPHSVGSSFTLFHSPSGAAIGALGMDPAMMQQMMGGMGGMGGGGGAFVHRNQDSSTNKIKILPSKNQDFSLKK